MASPLVIFSLGIGTVIGALGAGFGGSYFLTSSQPVKETKRTVAKSDAPPPTVEKVEQQKAGPLDEAEPSQPQLSNRTETTGSGGWQSEPVDRPVAAAPTPVFPYTAPVPAARGPAALPPVQTVAPTPAATPPAVPSSSPRSAKPPTALDHPDVTAPRIRSSDSERKAEKQIASERSNAKQIARQRTKKDDKRNRTVRERDYRQPVIVERWRERVVDDDYLRHRAQAPGGNHIPFFGFLFGN